MEMNHNTEKEKINSDKRRWQKQTKVDEEKQNKKVLSESISNWLPIYNIDHDHFYYPKSIIN